MEAYYTDYWTEFDCIILACSSDGTQYMILDTDNDLIGWCSCHLVD